MLYYGNGNMRTENEAGRKFVSEYVYDKHGNWTRCLEEVPNDWQNDKQLTIREIDYY